MIKGPSGCGEDGREGFGGGDDRDAGDRGLGGFGYRWSDIDDRWQKGNGAVVAGGYGGFDGDHRGGGLQEQDMFSLR